MIEDHITRTFALECDSWNQRGSRRLQLVANIRGDDRDDYWLAAVDPPFAALAPFEVETRQVIVATKWAGQSLFDKRERIPVYIVLVPDQEVLCTHRVSADRIKVALWCIARPID